MLSMRRRSEAATTALVLGAFSGAYRSPPILCTNRGYSKSVIFSLFAKSNARSKGILQHVSPILVIQMLILTRPLSNALANFDNVPRLFGLENTIATATGHAGYVQQLCAVDEVIVWKIGQRGEKHDWSVSSPSLRATQTPFAST